MSVDCHLKLNSKLLESGITLVFTFLYLPTSETISQYVCHTKPFEHLKTENTIILHKVIKGSSVRSNMIEFEALRMVWNEIDKYKRLLTPITLHEYRN